MRSIPRLELCVLLVASLCCACPDAPNGPRLVGAGHTKPVYGGTLILSEEAKVRSLDPHVAFDEISGVLIGMLFDSLYRYDRNMQVEPLLAQSMPELSADGLVLHIALKPGVHFHNGRELTAEDVVWSFERMLDPALNSPGAPYYTSIVGVDEYAKRRVAHVRGFVARDPTHLQITLKQADQSFVHKLAMPFTAVLPKEVVLAKGDRFGSEPVGTGPFMFEDWERGVRLSLRRNPRYFAQGIPYLDRVLFEEDIKRETAFLRFRNGELDIISRVSPPDKALLETPKWRPFMALSSRVDVFGIAMNAEMFPFDNVHVRRAVAFAIDRERWSKARNFGIYPAGQLLPPALAGYDPKLPNLQRFDLARAKEELRLAGFPNGLKEPVTLWGVDSSTMRSYGELLQADLAKIGIEVSFKFVSFPVYLEQSGTRKTAQMMYTGWVMDYPDASNFLGLMSRATISDKDSYNRAFYHDPWLDKHLDEALIERNPENRVAMYREANDFVAKEAPWAFFANSLAPQAWQPYVKNYRPHPVYWMQVNDVWLDLPRKRIADLRGRSAPALRHAALLPWVLSP